MTGRPALLARPGLVLALVVTASLVATAAVLRTAVAGPGEPPLPDRLLSVLLAAAIVLAALLALPRSSGIAWAGAAFAAALAALEVVAGVRAVQDLAQGSSSRELLLIGGLALVGGVSVSSGYAAHARPGAAPAVRVALALVMVGLASTAVAAVWLVLDGDQAVAAHDAATLTPIRIAARIAIASMVFAIVVGAGRDLGPPVVRAWHSSSPTRAGVGTGRFWNFLRLVDDELMPDRAAVGRRAVEAERARLAAELHAVVLPDLRRAAAAAASAGAAPEIQVDLRRALDDVEQLMHHRQSIVLEQFGLVAALEWLAERTEERSQIRVQLEFDGDVPDQPDAVDRKVARAAFRIALLALDNVVRHADAAKATLRLSADETRLRLIVEDDGQAGVRAATSGGRGMTDMRTEAAASGGSIEITSGPRARIQAAWPAARK
jgi:signal transduction histidine kinase